MRLPNKFWGVTWLVLGAFLPRSGHTQVSLDFPFGTGEDLFTTCEREYPGFAKYLHCNPFNSKQFIDYTDALPFILIGIGIVIFIIVGVMMQRGKKTSRSTDQTPKS